MDFIRQFFGLPSKYRQFNETYRYHDDEINRIPKSKPPNEDIQRRGFHVFTDPLQMHQYFEHEINEMLKRFGFQGFDDGFFSEFHNVPALEAETKLNENGTYSGELRDQFLKHGYEKPSQKHFDKTDKDIDEKVNVGDLDSIFGGGKKVNPFHKESPPEGFFFGHSQSLKTIRNSDGSIETHHTVRDNEGNEELTVCHKIGDKEYCTIKKKDKHGREEVIENFINMNENEKNEFFKPRISKIEDPQNNDFSFDKFFK